VSDELNRLAPGLWGGAFTRMESSGFSFSSAVWPVTNPLKHGYCAGDVIVPWTAWALEPDRPGDKPPWVESWNDVTACVHDNINNYTLWNADWNAFGDTLYRLELFTRHEGEYGERNVEPEPARLALLKAVQEAQKAIAAPR
jgi:hypothetical protein